MQNIKLLIFIGIAILGVVVSILSFYVIPEANQLQMYPYNNTYKEGEVGFKTTPYCPTGNHTDGITVLGIVEEHRTSSYVPGARLNVVLICKCEKHNLVYSLQ